MMKMKDTFTEKEILFQNLAGKLHDVIFTEFSDGEELDLLRKLVALHELMVKNYDTHSKI